MWLPEGAKSKTVVAIGKAMSNLYTWDKSKKSKTKNKSHETTHRQTSKRDL